MRLIPREVCASAMVALMILSGLIVLHPVQNGSAGKPVAGPDLIVTNIWWVDSFGTTLDASPVLTSGQPFTVCATVANSGNRDAGPFSTSLTVDGVSWGLADCSGLAVGYSATLSWSAQFISQVSSYSATVKADSTSIVPERMETNNELSEAFSIVTADWTIAIVLSGDSPMMFCREQDGQADYWTNDLEECAIDNFINLAEQGSPSGGSSPKISIVVMMDMRDGSLRRDQSWYQPTYYDSNGWSDTKLFFVTPGLKPLASNCLADEDWPAGLTPGEQNLGDPYVISEFSKWAFLRFQSNEKMLILQGFGEGWKGMFRDIAGASDVATTTFDELTLAELSGALSSISQSIGEKIGVVGLDALFMSQLEVLDSITPSAEYVVAHIGKEPEFNSRYSAPAGTHHSWPYQKIVDGLKQSPSDFDILLDLDGDSVWDPDEFAYWMVLPYADNGPYAWYYEFWSGGALGPYPHDASHCSGEKVISSMPWNDYRNSLIPNLNALANALIDKIMAAPDYKQTIQSARKSQSWTVNDYYWYYNQPSDTVEMHRYADLGNFANALRQLSSSDADIQQLCTNLESTIIGCVRMYGQASAPFVHPVGLSIYWPETPSLDTPLSDTMVQEVQDYSSLAFSQNNRWDDFLRAYNGIPDPPDTPTLGGPELNFRFDEASGNIACDSSGHGYTGTLKSWPSGVGGTTTFDPYGVHNGCVKFDDLGLWDPLTRIECGSICYIPGDLTITVWIRIEDTRGRSGQWIVAKQQDTGYDRYTLALFTTYPTYSDYTPQFLLGGYRTYPGVIEHLWLCAITGEPLTKNEWHFIAVERHAATGEAKMFVDGTWYYPSIAVAGPGNPVGPLWVGDSFQGPAYGRNFVGRIDDLRIFDESATDAEIEAIYMNIGAPSPPQNLQIAASNSRIALGWSPPAGASPPTSYKVYRGTSSGEEQFLASVTGVLSYLDRSVTNNVDYWYYVTAANAAGESASSNEVTAKPIGPPLPPTNLAVEPGNGQAILSWSGPSNDGGSPLLCYDIFRGLSQDSKVWIGTVGAGVSTFTDTGVRIGQTYDYVVRAVNSFGWGPFSNEASVDIPATLPGNVPNLKATAAVGKITLTWSAAPDGGSTVTQYIIYRSTRSGQEQQYASVNGDMLTYVDTGVSAGKTYYYKVTAVNAVGENPLQSSTEVWAKVPR